MNSNTFKFISFSTNSNPKRHYKTKNQSFMAISTHLPPNYKNHA